MRTASTINPPAEDLGKIFRMCGISHQSISNGCDHDALAFRLDIRMNDEPFDDSYGQRNLFLHEQGVITVRRTYENVPGLFRVTATRAYWKRFFDRKARVNSVKRFKATP